MARTRHDLLAINRKAIGFTFINDGKWVSDYVKIDGLLKYSLTFVRSMHTRMNAVQSHQPYYWNRVFPIETDGVAAFDFNISKEKMKSVISMGEKYSRRFFDVRQQMIESRGPLPRNLFIPTPKLRNMGIEFLSNELLDDTFIYQTNPAKFKWNKLPIEKCFSCA